MRRAIALAVLVVAAAAARPAAAHVALIYPPSRYGDLVLKEGPCGESGGARTTHVTTLEPGAEIEVVWDEYVDHPGHFRIAFDADGDDDFVDPACLGGCTTRTPEIETYSNATVVLDAIADTAGGRSSAIVTLPDVECERCTLQLIQVMYDKPPYVTPGNDLYYQCADLVLRRTAPLPCPGDCDGDRHVGVGEIVAGVRISLGTSGLGECPAFDSDDDARIGIGDIVRAVAAALNGCPL